MPNCRLIVDSCCDLPFELVDKEGIDLLKFPYVCNGGTFEDDLFVSRTPEDFYNGMRNGDEPTTAQLTIPMLQEMFERAAQDGTPTVYLSFTSGLSGSYDVAMIVRDIVLAEHPDFELYVVDTLLPSVAEGMLVMEAINQWEKGMTAAELVAWAEEARFFVDEIFMVEDLNALRRGGRIPSTVAVAGSALDVKPLLTVDAEGKLAMTGIARGRKKGIKQMVEYFLKNAADPETAQLVVVAQADCPKDVQRMKDALLKVNPNLLFLDANIGPVIGSHVGPEMIAIGFWGNDQRKKLSVAERIAKRVKSTDSKDEG